MARLKQFPLVLLVLLIFIIGCQRNQDIYKPPKWLAGKLYSQIETESDLSTFAKCLKLTGYDTIINVSGSYTVFAPSNEAFDLYLQQHPEYGSVEDIPISKLTGIVQFDIVQDAWSKSQLRTLDVYGWIDTTDVNNYQPKGFKRQTLYLSKDMKVGVVLDKGDYKVVDTLSSNVKRRILTDSRKYAPIFYKEYFDIYKLSTSDYSFYFGRPFDSANDIYFAGAKITGDPIFAENGFIYNIDRVVEPLQSGYQILASKDNVGDYTDFLALLNTFPAFTYNEQRTNEQPGAREGLRVDSLFDMTFPELLYSVNNELTRAPAGTAGLPQNVTIRYQYGLIAPTNSAFQDFLTEYIEGPKQWGYLENAPRHLKKIIVNSYLAPNPIYQTDIDKGFYNGELDIVHLDPSTIIEKKYGSNVSFIGLNKALIPRALSSVTGPIYRQQGFSTVMNAIEDAGLLSALKREGEHYSLYVEDDLNLKNDSSLLRDPATGRYTLFTISADGTATKSNVGITDLRTLIMNQVGVQQPNGIAKKEFIKNLAGNYIIVDNETGIVSGTAASSDGYHGQKFVDIIPKKVSTDADNGTTYDVGDWFTYSSTNLYSKISSVYPKFQALMQKAGLANSQTYTYSFLSESENYTVFVPTDSAIDNFDFNSLTKEQLQNLLKLHFVQGKMIFTDGNQSSGYYETARIDESSTPYSTVFTKIYVSTGYDVIKLRDKNGGDFVTVNESPTSNQIMARTLDNGGQQLLYPLIITNAVVHQINKVLTVDELDTK